MFSIDLINTLLALWLKPTVVLVLILAVSRYSYRFSASANHWLLTCALFSTFTAMLAQYWLPSVNIGIVPEKFSLLANISILSEGAIAAAATVLVFVYLLGVFGVVFFQLFGLLDILIVLRSARNIQDDTIASSIQCLCQAIGVRKHVRVVESLEVLSPAVFGHCHPVIILPTNYKSWPQDRLQRVLAHELAHIARGDWLAKMFSKGICAALWAVPLVWYIADRLEWYAELACDDTVVRVLDCRTEYAEDLMQISSVNPHAGWLMSFNRASGVFLRIQHILDSRNQRSTLGLWPKIGNMALCIVFAFPMSLVHAVPIPKPPLFIELGSFSNEEAFGAAKTELSNKMPEPSVFKLQELKSLTLVLPPSLPNLVEAMMMADPSSDDELERWKASVKHESIAFNIPKEIPAKISAPNAEINGVLPILLVKPKYPRKAISRGIEGDVIAQFNIDEDGNVVEPKIIFSSSRNIFDHAVLKALRRSKFTPMTLGGRNIKINNMTETFNFRLLDRAKKTSSERTQSYIAQHEE